MIRVSDSAQVHPKAQLGRDVSIGPYAVIGENVVIGDRTTIGSHAVIEGWTEIGRENRIHHFAVLGTEPQDLKWKGARSWLRIGDRNSIREFATLNRATEEDEETRVGDDNLIMSYVHVAHNCRIEDGTILANAVNLAGHVVVEERAVVGGVTPVHQFVRIGRHAMIGGGFRVPKDVPPYLLAGGNPLRAAGINQVGLERRGFTEETMAAIKEAYRLLYRAGFNRSQAIERIRANVLACPEVEHLVRFISESQRGTI
jgi:UDP-N-acetylglucosamine acyltransferase